MVQYLNACVYRLGGRPAVRGLWYQHAQCHLPAGRQCAPAVWQLHHHARPVQPWEWVFSFYTFTFITFNRSKIVSFKFKKIVLPNNCSHYLHFTFIFGDNIYSELSWIIGTIITNQATIDKTNTWLKDSIRVVYQNTKIYFS